MRVTAAAAWLILALCLAGGGLAAEGQQQQPNAARPAAPSSRLARGRESPSSSSSSAPNAMERCLAAGQYISRSSREMRKLFIPIVQHPQGARTLSNKPGCMVTNTGWWTYEFCFGDFIRQFHEENGVVVSENIIGLSGHALEKDSIAMEAAYNYKDGGLSRFLSKIREVTEDDDESLDPNLPQYALKCIDSLSSLLRNKQEGAVVVANYDKGSVCGAEKKRRTATVFMICDATLQPDPTKRVPIFFDIAETSPCEYQLFVRGDSMCSIMNMLPPSEPSDDAAVGGSGGAANGAQQRKRRGGGGTTEAGNKKQPQVKADRKKKAQKESSPSSDEIAEPADATKREKRQQHGTAGALSSNSKEEGEETEATSAAGAESSADALIPPNAALLANDPRREAFEGMPRGVDEEEPPADEEDVVVEEEGGEAEAEEGGEKENGQQIDTTGDAEAETDEHSNADLHGRRFSSYYPLGIDDPAFFEDSFIMSI